MTMHDPNAAAGGREASDGDDFMAGFGDDEGGTATGTADGGGDAGAGAGGAAGADAGGAAADTGADAPDDANLGAGAGAAAPGAAQGVDAPENREQVSAQSEALDLSGLPEPIRQRLEEAEKLRQQNEQLTGTLEATRRDYNALHGRVAPLQSQLAALTRAQPQPAQTGAPPQGQSGGSAQLAEADQAIADAEAYFASDEFKTYEKTWPEEAKVARETQMRTLKAVRSLAAQTAQQVSTLGRTIQTDIAPHLQQVRSNQAEQARVAELQNLHARHPDWAQLNDSDEFWNWFTEQKPLLNFQDDAHMRSRLNDSLYVSALLDRYKRDVGAGSGQPRPQQDQSQGNAAGAEGGAGNAQAVNARLALAGGPDKSGSQPIPRGSAGGLTPGDDFLAGFNEQ